MSLTKSGPAYERWAEEQRDDLDHSYEEYLESLYMRGRQRFPADDEQPEQPAEDGHNNQTR